MGAHFEISDIATVWADVIGIESADPSVNFFDLGGHSLMLVDLVEALNDRVGTDLDVLTLMQNPTIATLALHLNSATASPDG